MKYMVQRSFQTATKFFKTSEIIPKPSSFSALNSFKIYAVIIIMLLLHATIVSEILQELFLNHLISPIGFLQEFR